MLGVSPDSVESHRKFAENYGLPFTLLADPEKAVIQAYGVWKEKTMYGKKSMGVGRTTVVIDGQGLVRKIFPKVEVDAHGETVLETIRGL